MGISLLGRKTEGDADALEPRAKIAIAMATHDMVPSSFMYSLASLVMVTTASLPDDVQLGVNMVSGTYVHSARQELLESLLAQGVSHILWLDTDHTFPRDALVRLLQHDKPVVGINYAQRGVPSDFVAIKKVGWTADEDSEKLQTTKRSSGLEEVEAVGFGMVLMRADALAKLPPLGDGPPWFWFDWLEDKGQQVGEDVRFCKILRDQGVPIYVDHDLSKECAHVGQFDYRCEHAED